jgi:pimeloyl-ACP methyl ester carboxylesterase
MTGTNSTKLERRSVLAAAAALTAAGALAPTSAHAETTPSASAKTPAKGKGPKPTVVLVHGAFADASGFADVIAGLQRRGFTVLAPPNPLRGLASDSASLTTFLGTIEGPIILGGHSYGGAVITNAATGNANVKALVYVSAYALDEHESAIEANDLGGGPPPLLLQHLVLRPYAGAPKDDADVTIDPAFFRPVFAADLPRRQAAVMASAQRPVTFFSLGAKSGPAAWKTIPSYYVVAKHDNAIPPAAERVMAERAGSETVELDSSHVAMTSHPHVVVDLVRAAARAHRR